MWLAKMVFTFPLVSWNNTLYQRLVRNGGALQSHSSLNVFFFFSFFETEGLAKRSQHFNATSCCIRLATLLRYVACVWPVHSTYVATSCNNVASVWPGLKVWVDVNQMFPWPIRLPVPLSWKRLTSTQNLVSKDEKKSLRGTFNWQPL